MDISRILQIIGGLLASVIILTLHEFAHAFVAYKCGDPTAKFSGRMTLNPLKHFDPLGIVTFALVGFGWAKPVPVNPYNFKNYKWGSFLTSAAGVFVNYLTCFIFCPILGLVYLYLLPVVEGTYAEILIYSFFVALVVNSLSFCVFNLLPFYPLDGFRMVDAFAKKRGKFYWFLRKYGYYILLGLILLHYLARMLPILGYIDVLGYVLDFVISIFSKPITLFWEWIFGLFNVNIKFKLF